MVFSNSVSADRIVVAASRLLGAAAACVILLSFAAEQRKSYWNGCIQAAIVIWQQIFLTLALVILCNFPLKNPLNKCFKIVLFLLWRRDPSGFEAAISDSVARSSIVFCNSVSADRIVVAASRLLGMNDLNIVNILLSMPFGTQKNRHELRSTLRTCRSAEIS